MAEMYVIKKGSKYYAQFANQWVDRPGSATGATIKEGLTDVAKRVGGKVVKVDI